MAISETSKIDVKSKSLTGQRVIKVTQNGEDMFLPVGLSSLNPNGGGGGGESSGIKFYECQTYTPDADAYTKYSFTMSGATDTNANTTYERTKWVETPDTGSDYATTAQWTATNGYTIVEESGWDEFYYYIKNASGTNVYGTDTSLSARATDYSTIPWVDMDMHESVTLTFSAISTEDVPATTEGWTGVLMQQDASTGAWSASATDPVDLTVQYLTPKVGEIYSEDTSIQVRKMFDGSVIPIPGNGLVFYAPLQADYVDMISGQTASTTGGAFTSFAGVDCLRFSGDSFVNWPTNSSLALGTSPCSFIALISPVSQSNWRIYLTLGPEKGMRISVNNGYIESSASNSLTVGVWQSVIVTRNESGTGCIYLNGALEAEGVTADGVPTSPPSVMVGAGPLPSYRYYADGYVAHTAIYDRELTAAEVLEIHNTLMEGVAQ